MSRTTCSVSPTGTQHRMSIVKNVFNTIRSLLQLFRRKRVISTGGSEPAAGVVVARVHEGRTLMTGFDMKTEIAKLSRRILEPVAAKLDSQDLDNTVDRIRCAFEEINITPTPVETDFEVTAINILGPIQPMLTEADFTRVVDRLRGAMAGFCQGNRDRSAA
jgi:hypothetical protein